MVRIWYPALFVILALCAGPGAAQPGAAQQGAAQPGAAQHPPESSSSGPDGKWKRYVPKKDRKNVTQGKMTQLAGFGGAMKINNVVTATWVTSTAARWLVSEEADERKLTPDEAEAHYSILRPETGFLFLVNLRYADPFESRRARSALDLFVPGQTLLQRKGDPETFSRAIQELEVSRGMLPSSAKFENAYYIVMPRTTDNGRPIVERLDDKVEFRFVIEGKKVTLEFSVKELATSLADL